MLIISGLVKKFQENLEISRTDAIQRVGFLVFFLFCLMSFTFFSIIFFYLTDKFENKVPLFCMIIFLIAIGTIAFLTISGKSFVFRFFSYRIKIYKR